MEESKNQCHINRGMIPGLPVVRAEACSRLVIGMDGRSRGMSVIQCVAAMSYLRPGRFPAQ
jgi:hypothetical protein